MRFFLRMESSRWNFLGGVVQEKICLEEIYMLSSELVEFPRWNFLGALLQGWFHDSFFGFQDRMCGNCLLQMWPPKMFLY